MKKDEIVAIYESNVKQKADLISEMKKEIVSLLQENNLTEFDFLEGAEWDYNFENNDEYHYSWDDDYYCEGDDEFQSWYYNDAIHVTCESSMGEHRGFMFKVKLTENNSLDLWAMDNCGIIFDEYEMDCTNFDLFKEMYEKIEEGINNQNN